jgi:hypothetical protein
LGISATVPERFAFEALPIVEAVLATALALHHKDGGWGWGATSTGMDGRAYEGFESRA